MQFPQFYGNEGLKRRLTSSGEKLSHCYILEGPAGSGKKTLARILSAAMQCEGKGEKPCGVCSGCRKVMKGEHPDVVYVDSTTATIPIRLIRDMQADAYVKPNEGRRKIYVIPRAQDMQGPAQNALLKLLEEPPAYCAFLLLTDSMEKLLETVRSRAVVLSLSPLSRQELLGALKAASTDASEEALARAMERSDGYLGAALTLLETPDTEMEERTASFVKAYASGDELELYMALLSLEKYKRPDLIRLLTELYRTFVRAMDPDALRTRDGALLAKSATRKQLFAGAEALSHALTLAQANGSAGHVAGILMAELRP